MKLEQEAEAYSEGKRKQFNQALQEYMQPIVQYLNDNLHNTKERDDIMYHLLATKLLSKHCAETHGIK